MLSKEQTKELQDILGGDQGTLEKIIAAIKSPGEVKVELPKGKLFTDETLEIRDKAMKDEGMAEGEKAHFKNGKDKGLEIQGQVLLKKFGIDPATVKAIDPDKVAEAIHAAIAKGDAGLQEQVRLLMEEKEKVIKNFEKKESELEAQTFDNNLLSNMPVKRNTKIFNDKEYLITTKSNLEFEKENGQVFPKEKGGDYLRHPETKAKLPLKEGLDAYFNKRGWIEKEGNTNLPNGRGGTDNMPQGSITGVRSASEFEKTWEKDHPNQPYGQPDSVAALKEAAAAAGANWSWA